MAKPDEQLSRIDIEYFEGVNTLVSDHVSKKNELRYVENARSDSIGSIERRAGTSRLGNDLGATANYGLYFFDDSNSLSTGMYRVSTVTAVTSVYYLNTSATWTALAGGGTALTAAMCSFTQAEGCMFIANGTDDNRYVSSDGTTVVTSTTSSGHLYNCPDSYLINYYKDRLYIGDYTITTRYKTGVMMSSKPVGLISLVDGDHTAPITTLNVTDTKYIHSSDSLDIYRGNTLIGTVTVTAKTQDSLTITSFGTNITSADEVWVAGTYTGAKVFRWVDNPASGINVKQYDTFKLSGEDYNPLTVLTNIGNIMVIANNNSMAVWDDSRLYNFDLGIGCVSKQGYVKATGSLFFIHYTGIYTTSGDRPRLISSKVEQYINGATRAGLEASAMGRKGFSIFCSIGTVTLTKPDGSALKTLTNVVLEYDMRQENWYVHTGLDIDYFCTYIGSLDPDRLQSCGATGEVYEMLYGTKDSGTNDIPMDITLSTLTLDKDFEKICQPREIIIETERGSGIKCFVSMDGGNYYELQGEAMKGCTIIKVTPRNNEDIYARCRKISISLRDYSSRICKVSRVSLLYARNPDEEIYKPQL